MANYNTSITTNGLADGGFQTAIDKLRAPRSGGLSNNLFNLNAYQKKRINPQAMSEMNTRFDDTNRSSRWNAANDLQRNYDQADQQAKMNQLGAATSNATNYLSNENNLANQQQGLALNNVQFMNSLFSNLFGNIMPSVGNMVGGGQGMFGGISNV